MATVTQGRLVYEGGRARLPRRPILHVLEKDSKGTRRQCLAGFLQGRSRHLANLRSKKTVEPSCYEPSWCMIKMTEKAPEPHVEEDDDELDGKLNYKPPPQKSLKELQEMDKDDESLTKYKKTLLGDGPVVADPTAPNVTVTRLTLVCESAPGPITMDLTGDLEALKKETFVLKEGVEYRVKINFKVNKDIVSGLKYVQHTYRTGVKVEGPPAPESAAMFPEHKLCHNPLTAEWAALSQRLQTPRPGRGARAGKWKPCHPDACFCYFSPHANCPRKLLQKFRNHQMVLVPRNPCGSQMSKLPWNSLLLLRWLS
uniref:Endoplasmic reticulum protein 27 n=1 Tax=Bos taurus TaxID=9913 RepID=A0AAA9S453_BOVIN